MVDRKVICFVRIILLNTRHPLRESYKVGIMALVLYENEMKMKGKLFFPLITESQCIDNLYTNLIYLSPS